MLQPTSVSSSTIATDPGNNHGHSVGVASSKTHVAKRNLDNVARIDVPTTQSPISATNVTGKGASVSLPLYRPVVNCAAYSNALAGL